MKPRNAILLQMILTRKGGALVTNRGGQTIAFFSYRDRGSPVPGPKNMRRRS